MLSRSFFIMLLISSLCFFANGCDKSRSDWKQAQSENTISSYTKFIADHPQSEYCGEAKQRIDKIEWHLAIKANTLEAIEEFIDLHPESAFIDDAKKHIEVILIEDKILTPAILCCNSQLRYTGGYASGEYVLSSQVHRILDAHAGEVFVMSNRVWMKFLENGVAVLFGDDWVSPAFSGKLPSVEYKNGRISIESGNIQVFEDTQSRMNGHTYIFKAGKWVEVDY